MGRYWGASYQNIQRRLLLYYRPPFYSYSCILCYRWRSLFYFLTGLGTAVLIAGIFAIDQDPKAQTDNDQVDWIGAFVITSGLTLTTFALTDASSASWSSPLILSLLVLGITFIGLFLAWEYYLVHHTSFPPLMPLDIWARDHGRFAAMQVVSAMEWACFMNFGMYAMLYYQNYLGLSPLLAVCRFLPMHVTGMICNIIVIFVVDTINGAYLLGLFPPRLSNRSYYPNPIIYRVWSGCYDHICAFVRIH